MKRNVTDWLNVIADDTIRESAIEQWDNIVEKVDSLERAVFSLAYWQKNSKDISYWVKQWSMSADKKLNIRTYTAPNGDYFDGEEWIKSDKVVESDHVKNMNRNDDKAIEHAILLLESQGYKITKP